MAGEQTIITAMDFLKETFDKYASMDDDKGTMSKTELNMLLKKHLEENNDKRAAHYFKQMDEDKDSKVSFKEYMNYLTSLYDWEF